MKQENKSILIEDEHLNYLLNVEDLWKRKRLKIILMNELQYIEKNEFKDEMIFKILPFLSSKVFGDLISNELFAIQPLEREEPIEVVIAGEKRKLIATPFTLRFVDPKTLKIIFSYINDMYSRKLKVNWRQEAIEDIKKIHSINLRNEINDFLSYNLQYEIDKMLIDAAYGLIKEDQKFTFSFSASEGRCSEEKYKDLYKAILININYVETQTRRGKANNIIIDLNTANILREIKAFDKPLEDDEYQSGEGYVFLGTIEKGTVTVYLDLNWKPENENQMGYVMSIYSGKKNFDRGIIYCPHSIIPMKYIDMTQKEEESIAYSFILKGKIVTDFPDSEKYFSYMNIVASTT